MSKNTGQNWWQDFDYGSVLGGAASVIDSINGNSDTQVNNYYQSQGATPTAGNNNDDDKGGEDNTLMYVGIGIGVLVLALMGFAILKK